MVGFDLADDAGVYLLDKNTALVQTVDVITPLVDDPATFGRIAAANAISDIYAMGARPLTALNIAAFPDKELSPTVLGKILKGGLEICELAKCALMGGHTLRDEEIKFGMAVTGVAHPSEIVTNAGAKPGDVIVLTKPLGTGLISTALKRKRASLAAEKAAVKSMTTLNRDAAAAMKKIKANACTDVTGFGLLGHATELARASKVTIEIEFASLPLLPDVEELAKRGMAPGGTGNNIAAFFSTVETPPKFDALRLDILFDPQTSGGLLIFVPEKKAGALVKELKRLNTPAAAIIGRVLKKRKGVDIIVK